MATFISLSRRASILTLLCWACSLSPTTSGAAEVTFDLPETIECRDVTPCDFGAAHPQVKVIEGKLRISARIDGAESDIVEFMYVISSPDKTLRIQDYLPNTTLESAVADDQIEVTDSSENTKAISADAHVGYQALGLGLSKSKAAKKAESNHYKQIVSKSLVLSSGTIDREHGVYFRLRPSNSATLEGAKEFTFLAIVNKSWRGDWCVISCTAKARKKSLFSTTVVPAGSEEIQVGLHLVGDEESGALARRFRQVQDAHTALFVAQASKEEGWFDSVTTAVTLPATATFHTVFKPSKSDQPLSATEKKMAAERKHLAKAQKAVFDVQDRLRELAK